MGPVSKVVTQLLSRVSPPLLTALAPWVTAALPALVVMDAVRVPITSSSSSSSSGTSSSLPPALAKTLAATTATLVTRVRRDIRVG